MAFKKERKGLIQSEKKYMTEEELYEKYRQYFFKEFAIGPKNSKSKWLKYSDEEDNR